MYMLLFDKGNGCHTCAWTQHGTMANGLRPSCARSIANSVACMALRLVTPCSTRPVTQDNIRGRLRMSESERATHTHAYGAHR